MLTGTVCDNLSMRHEYRGVNKSKGVPALNTLLLERNVNAFLTIARSDPRVLSGMLETLRRFREEGIHGKCAAEAIRYHLVETESVKSEDPHTISNRLMTCTHLTEGARKLLEARLRYDDIN